MAYNRCIQVILKILLMAMTSSQFGRQDGDNSEKQAKLRRFESELVVFESDRNKLARKTEETNLELRIAQKKWNDLGFEIKEKQDLLKKNQDKLQFLEEEIRILKKKINTL